MTHELNLLSCLGYKSWCDEATASTPEPSTSFATTETESICDSTPNQVTFTCRSATRQVYCWVHRWVQLVHPDRR